MINRKHRMKPAGSGMMMLALLTILVTAGLGAANSATAQSNGGMVIGATLSCDATVCGPEFSVQVSVTTEDGELIGSCTVTGNVLDQSHVPGCVVDFPSQPTGTLIVTEDVSTLPASYGPVENPMYVDSTQLGSASHDVIFQNVLQTVNAGTAQTSDVAIATTENGGSATDVCYVLVDFSNEGCDRNGDGQVTFEDVPVGAYTVRQTADLGPGRSVDDFTIQVTGNTGSGGREVFSTTVDAASGGSLVQPSSDGAVDISLITRDPDGGELLTGTCYVLLDYSNEGCDENGDGQVTFADVPYDTYTVQQTRTPGGYPTINDFPITVDDAFPNVPVGYLVRQAPEQNASGTRNVSFIFVDSRASTKIVPSPICVQIGDVSNVGCDRDLIDGQIDFLDVRSGTHELAFSNLPSAWQIMGSPSLAIEAGPGPQIVFMTVDTGIGSGSASGSEIAGTGAIAVVGSQTGTTSGGTSGTSSSDTPSAGVAVELILDTSDSMNERDQGSQTRIEVAKTVTTRMVTETLPAGVPMALRTFTGCSSSLTMPMQPLDPNAAAATIADLRASGDTPIAQSLRAAGNDLENLSGPKLIVLVTDGEETCGGDPGAAIETLVAQDVNVQVNIVGFAIDDAALTATFQEWARVGNGTYYEASNELELDRAVTTASQLSFRVIDQQGSEIADGVVGGDAVTVPVGTWTVEIDTTPVTIRENVVVTEQETTTIDLGASGTTDTGGDATTFDPGQNDQVIVPIVPQDSGQDPAGSAQETWTASVQVSQCNLPPNSGPDMICDAEGGIVVDISLASGELLGSCTVGEPQPTPWGVSISTCAVEGMPFNADLVATQDPSTIPAGYEPSEEALFLRVDDLIPGGGDQATFTFFNVQTDAGSTGSSGTASTSGVTEATVLMTFRACPEGFVPDVDDPYTACTIPLDAPDASRVGELGNGPSLVPITGLAREYDGSYIFTANSNVQYSLELTGLEPVLRDGFLIYGVDDQAGASYITLLDNGETHEIFVFYYYD